MADAASDILIKPISPEQASVALQLFQTSSRQCDWERLFELMLEDRLDEEKLFVAARDDMVVGAVWAKILTGTSGQIMAPVSLPDQIDVQQSLLRFALGYLRERGVEFATCEVGSADNRDELFQNSGFAFAANVQSMVCPLPTRWDSDDLGKNSPVEIEPAKDLASLTRMLAETYKGSLDCPIVSEYRSAEDLVQIYAQSDQSNQEGWFVARQAGQDIGCILVSISGQQAEVVYFGVVPHCRGKEYGRSLLRFAHRFASKSGVNTIIADVDSRNSPAISIYESLGYVAFDFNRVFVASISNVG